ncbi:hypothetical protein E3P81_01958 [Wallemia ichthyophaga]|nr:hypothetical protein E3P97_01957 [Wallemia ichthyophaga]TIB32967.1 hypothetical protein E3P85_01590 [Wallemia ichthyophaga]TIB46824.1 hypothetical protein E3P82_01955 [Wallemia ichthyophaga]TIB51145.1 hypothetical protein E3P81_01958 [Wallemia ichthyophaga]TIB53787.1 hypothetical protein E3P80_01956 [Wallemia ichthyophaga]
MVYVPYISSKLPNYDGPYPVGAFDLELPVDEPDEKQSASFKIDTDPEPLKLETVLFTLYYPTDKKAFNGKGKLIKWFPRPFASTAYGYAKLAEISRTFAVSFAHALARSTKIPAYDSAPLASCPTGKWPLIIFSHGLGGQRRMYSHLCGSLASHGYIVCAVEHRDGSAPTSWVYPPLNNRSEQGSPRSVTWYDWKQVKFEDPSKEESHVPLRDEQLDFRLRELEMTWKHLKRIAAGQGAASELMNHRKKVSGAAGQVNWDSFARCMDADRDVTFMGHSFGGATICRVATKSDGFLRCITLDPWSWWEIFPEDAISYPVFSPPHFDIKVPLLTINSEQFTVWHDNFRSVYDLHRRQKDKGLPSWLFTICGTLHASFSDINLIAPRLSKYKGMRINPKQALGLTVDVVREFTNQNPSHDRTPSIHTHASTDTSEFSVCESEDEEHARVLDERRRERPYELADEDKESIMKRWPPRLPPTSKELIKLKIGEPGHFVLHIKPREEHAGADVEDSIPSPTLPSHTPPDTTSQPNQQLPYNVSASKDMYF